MNMKKLNNNIIDLLVGNVLGDGHIGVYKDKKVYITLEQTIKHKEYITDIYNILRNTDLNLNDIKYYTRKDSRYNSVNTSIYFKLYSYELLNSLANSFLSENNTKIIPSNIEEYLNPITIAYWICDDGQLVKNGGITLCTDNYTLYEVELLIKALSNRYNLKCTIHYKKSKTNRIYYRIYINKSSFKELKPLIINYVHKSFLYKLHE